MVQNLRAERSLCDSEESLFQRAKVNDISGDIEKFEMISCGVWLRISVHGDYHNVGIGLAKVLGIIVFFGSGAELIQWDCLLVVAIVRDHSFVEFYVCRCASSCSLLNSSGSSSVKVSYQFALLMYPGKPGRQLVV